jgi:hypothetical protein
LPFAERITVLMIEQREHPKLPKQQRASRTATSVHEWELLPRKGGSGQFCRSGTADHYWVTATSDF